MRTERGFSQEDLSIALGFKSNGFVAQVENIKYSKKYNISHLNLIAGFFKCSPKDFLPNEHL